MESFYRIPERSFIFVKVRVKLTHLPIARTLWCIKTHPAEKVKRL